ncbi:hypothetical protein [Sphingomonas sp. KC8]|uniref:hypothetical protein n=1 Tax=Sphingomonas sp. KC8 TaxID=1030157 RepID=UPI0003017547|nr:hypothetical protein [Sphingomonas sp. KC8]
MVDGKAERGHHIIEQIAVLARRDEAMIEVGALRRCPRQWREFDRFGPCARNRQQPDQAPGIPNCCAPPLILSSVGASPVNAVRASRNAFVAAGLSPRTM